MTAEPTDASRTTGTPTGASPECGDPASELLDFYVNGSLEGDEAATVAAHVASCATCARDVAELKGLSESIATHGVGRSGAWSGRVASTWIGIAAAVVAIVAIGYSRMVPRAPATRIASSPTEPAGAPGAARDGAPAGSEVTLDLAAGTLRGSGGGTPTKTLEPEVTTLRLILFAPVPAADLKIGVVGPNGEEIVPEEAMPRPDPMNRIAIVVPAGRLATSGTYQVVLKGAGDAYSYPFEISHPSDRE